MRILLAALIIALSCASAKANWSLVPAAGEGSDCVLETEDVTTFDGYDQTPVKLRLLTNALRVETESNIDDGFGDLGLQVDDEPFVAADGVVDETDVEFQTDLPGIVEGFKRGRKVDVQLRFWPTYPATGHYRATFSLMGFTKAYTALEGCRGRSRSAASD